VIKGLPARFSSPPKSRNPIQIKNKVPKIISKTVLIRF
jgi:hypothetical protein